MTLIAQLAGAPTAPATSKAASGGRSASDFDRALSGAVEDLRPPVGGSAARDSAPDSSRFGEMGPARRAHSAESGTVAGSGAAAGDPADQVVDEALAEAALPVTDNPNSLGIPGWPQAAEQAPPATGTPSTAPATGEKTPGAADADFPAPGGTATALAGGTVTAHDATGHDATGHDITAQDITGHDTTAATRREGMTAATDASTRAARAAGDQPPTVPPATGESATAPGANGANTSAINVSSTIQSAVPESTIPGPASAATIGRGIATPALTPAPAGSASATTAQQSASPSQSAAEPTAARTAASALTVTPTVPSRAAAAASAAAEPAAGPIAPAGAPSASATNTVQPATAAPTPAAPTPAPFATQVMRPVFSLASAGAGEHVMTVNVTPDNLGPVTVRAHVGADGVRVELFAPTDAGREAIRAILPDLRRDLAGGFTNSSLDLSAEDGPANENGQATDTAGDDRRDVRADRRHSVAAADARHAAHDLEPAPVSPTSPGVSIDVLA